ncbi:MAG: KEOPS complex subunit Pcc1 [Candidatus Bathyarchaeota archaeon]|nr:KEOPS complex subunit Pcc1 [Candidatus Bathyarchaeota archaeon]
MNAKASVRLPFQSHKQLRSLLDALTPEVKRQVGVRSRVSLNAEAQTLVLEVEAEDTVALRAALNTYLRWINSTINVLESVV